MTIFLHIDDGGSYSNRWFLSSATNARVNNAALHQCHFRMDTEDIKTSTSLLTSDMRDLARQCSQLSFTSSQASSLLALRDDLGMTWDATQISYLSRAERQQQSKLSSKASSAEELISSFKLRDDVSFCMVS
jgi:hypothetical protein